MDWTGLERRTSGSERMMVEKPVSIFAGDKSGIVRARTVDLSTGGMRLDIGDSLSVGERILFRIDLGEGFDPAVQGGEVVWSAEDKGTGVRFTSADEVDISPAPRPATLPAEGDCVKLHIERMDHPLKVECVASDRTSLTVRTELPFLERGRNVRASYRDPDGRQGEFQGVLSVVVLEPEGDDPVPSIRLLIQAPGTVGTGDDAIEAAPPEPEPDGEEASPEGEAPEESCEAGEPVEEAAEPEDEGPWTEETTARDAVVPDEAPEASTEPEQAEADDPMSESFHSLTERVDAEEPEPSIEPRYVVLMKAACAWMMVNGRRAAEMIACGSIAAWERIQPWARRIAPGLAARVRTARAVLIPLLARIHLPSLGSRLTGRPSRFRKQRRRTTQVTTVEKVKKAIPAKARSRALVAGLVVAAVLGFGTGVWALTGLIKSGKDDAATAAEPAKGPEVSRGTFDMWGGSELASGSVVEPAPSDIVVEEPVVEPAVVEAAAEAAPAGTAVVEVPPPSDAPSASANGFYLGVNGEVTGYDYYALKSPPGLVVDVKGALPLKEGAQPINRPGIKKVKAVARESGSRFIIYFEGEKVPDFQVLPAGSTLEVRLDT